MPVASDTVSAVILAGGMAQRMGGSDKGWIKYNGQPLIQHVLSAIKPQVQDCLINANRSLDAYAALGCPVVKDLQDGYQGPLMGIWTGLHHAHSDWVLFVPCDGPHLPPDLAQRLLDMAEAEQADIAVATDGKRMQPVVALIRRSLESSLAETLAQGERKIDRWYAKHRTIEVDFSDHPDAFANINRPGDLTRLQQMPKILGFAAWSGTGKTTLLKKIIPQLKEKGIRVGIVKHAHHRFDVDHPGKDSYELRKSGAAQTMIASSQRWALMVEEEQQDPPSLSGMISRMDYQQLDLVLVEGFKKESINKIELHRPSVGKPLLHPDDPNIIAVASDVPVDLSRDLPLLDLNADQDILHFILEYLNN